VPLDAPPDARPLASVPPGTGGRLTLGSMPRTSGLRLAQLGLRAGAAVTVLARTSGGGRLVAVGTTRIGLDRDTSRQLALLPATEATAPSTGAPSTGATAGTPLPVALPAAS
jgi:Fe2+ transport system protein FeoA